LTMADGCRVYGRKQAKMCQGLFNVIRGFGDPLTEVARREH